MADKRMARKKRVCSWCSQTFSKDDHLARHVRSHTKERPFSCATCGKSFTRHDSLLRHSRSHMDDRRLPSQHASESAETISTLLNPVLSTTTAGSPANSYPSNAAQTASIVHSSPSTHESHATNQSLPCDYPAPLELTGMSGWAGSNFSQPVDGQNHHQLALEPTLETSGIDTANSNQWIFSPSSHQIPGWLVRDDFDMSVLNAHILPPGISFDSLDWSTDGFMTSGARSTQVNNNSNNNIVIQSPTEIITVPREDYIRRQWFTYLSPERSGHITPDVSNEPTSVDERYREDLSRELQQRVNNEPLPSTDFLNLCIQMYFTRFNPTFPIVHAPTFRPSAKRSLLLLSICSVGSLFLGSSFAVAQGVRIFERLNKAILASWESYIVRGAPDALAMTQAALIGQTFGMLSGNPRHLAIVQTFHGTIIAWARRQKMFDQTTAPIHSTGIAETELESAWRRWVHSEEKKRVAVGLRIHDAELAELFMVEPFLRSSANTRLTVAHNDAWTASTAKNWARVLRERDLTDSTYGTTSTDSSVMSSIIAVSPSFALYSLLEEKASYIMEHTQVHSPETQQQITQFLTSVYNEHLRHQTDSDPFSLKALWHSLFMSLYCDMNKIECAVGREGFEEAQNHTEYATIWASSAAGHRCAIHAALILKHLQRIPIGEEPAIHVPRLLYRASLIWYAYTRFGRDDYHGRQESSISAELEFPELTKAGIDGRRVLFAANGFKRTRPTTSESSTLFHLIDLLTRLGHWGISQKMASLFSVLIHDRPHYSES